MIGKADPPKPPLAHSALRKPGCMSEVRISSGFRHQPARTEIAAQTGSQREGISRSPQSSEVVASRPGA